MNSNPYLRFIFITLFSIGLIISALVGGLSLYTYEKETNASIFDALVSDHVIMDELLTKGIVWQIENSGVMGGPSLIIYRYKDRMLDYKIKHGGIDTLIFGSSSAASIRDYMFPKSSLFYNAANNEYNLAKNISEVKYYLDINKNLKWIYVNIEWAFGYPFLTVPVESYFGSTGRINDEHTKNLNPLLKISDAMTLQRVKIVFSNLMNEQTENQVYQCPEEKSLGIDLSGSDIPGICLGIRYDGSATFAGARPLTENRWKDLFTDGDSRMYRESLNLTKGVVNKEYLQELANINLRLKERGGSLVLIIPPMAPELITYLESLPEGKYLAQTFSDMNNFSTVNNIKLINAAKSEDYGCKFDDFIDGHHALPSCFEKVFKDQFRL